MANDPENPSPSEIVLFQTEDHNTRIEVRPEGGTVWLTQAQLAELFQTTPQNITLHLKAIYDEAELTEDATCKDYLQVRREGNRDVTRNLRHYNLDAILAAGFRVRSPRGTQFRQWAIARLKEYLVKGFVMDDEPGRDAKLKHRARHQLFPQGLTIVEEYGAHRIQWNGCASQALALEVYVRKAVEQLTSALEPDNSAGEPPLLPVINRFRAYRPPLRCGSRPRGHAIRH